MKTKVILFQFVFFLCAKGQGVNLPLSTEMTIEKSGVYDKNHEIQNVFEITNLADKGSHGSGFLIKGGVVLTNWHVVINAEPEQLKITESSGIEKHIKSVIVDSVKDLAILIPYGNLKGGFELESEDSILVGNQIYSWGFPFQYGPTALLTVGYISGFRVYIPDRNKQKEFVKHIIFNGAFNPGNSGGPMIDAKGKIVGIVQSKAIPLSNEVLSALSALDSNPSGVTFTQTDSKGNKKTLVESQVVAMVLTSYQKIAQVMIGEGVTTDEIKNFLHRNQIKPY